MVYILLSDTACSWNAWQAYADCSCKKADITDDVISIFNKKLYIVYNCVIKVLIEEETCWIKYKDSFDTMDKENVFKCFLLDPNMDTRLWTYFYPKIENALITYKNDIIECNCKFIITKIVIDTL